jgi:hypothetical protein
VTDTELYEAKLDSSLSLTSDVFVPEGVNPGKYYLALRNDIRANLCEPFKVRALVKEPGFPDIPLGETIEAIGPS